MKHNNHKIRHQKMIQALAKFVLIIALGTPQSGITEISATPESEAVTPKRLVFEPEMVRIPAGIFQMGCASGKYCRPNEMPVHDVTIEAFEIGKYEVTFEQWDECIRQMGCSHIPNTVWGRGNQPVIQVVWNDAQQYVRWLSQKTGKKYRLPTEAEWEYAARAETNTPFSTGECINPIQANYKGYYSLDAKRCSKTGAYQKQTMKVGSYAENYYGLFDMHGNVLEWVQDCYHSNYHGAPKDGSAWETDCHISNNIVTRVVRGGAWYTSSEQLRSAYRSWYLPVRHPPYTPYGFRVARSL